MKRDFLLGGTKLPTGGAVRGAGGAMSPPVFMLKEALWSIGPWSSIIVSLLLKAELYYLHKHTMQVLIQYTITV